MTEPSHYSLPVEASVATPTHVPRAWYDAQRNALHRAEGRAEALLAEITRLHKQIDSGRRQCEPQATAIVSPAKVAVAKSKAVNEPKAASKPASKPKRPELEITF